MSEKQKDIPTQKNKEFQNKSSLESNIQGNQSLLLTFTNHVIQKQADLSAFNEEDIRDYIIQNAPQAVSNRMCAGFVTEVLNAAFGGRCIIKNTALLLSIKPDMASPGEGEDGDVILFWANHNTDNAGHIAFNIGGNSVGTNQGAFGYEKSFQRSVPIDEKDKMYDVYHISPMTVMERYGENVVETTAFSCCTIL